jgi:hypothetical protein
MYIKIFRKDKTVSEFERYDGEIANFFSAIREDTPDSEIINVIFRVSYTIGDKSAFSDYEELVEMIDSVGSAKTRIENKCDYMFDLVIEGKLMDVIVYDEFLDPRHRFNLVDILMENDIILMDSLLRGVTLNHFSSNSSLILRFLSDKNGGMEYEEVLNILKKEIPKNSLKGFLPDIFVELYKCKPESAKTKPLEVDKMSLKSIKDETVKELDRTIRMYFNDNEHELEGELDA